MALLNGLAADKKKMKDGVVLCFPEDYFDPIRFRLAFWDIGFGEAMQKLPPEERARVEGRELTATEMLELYAKAVGEDIILGWENMQETVPDEDGLPQREDDGSLKTVEVPYSPEKALEIMRNPDFSELHEAIVTAAKDRARYRQDVLARAAGN